MKRPTAKCNRCGERISLVHPTKAAPNGSRFRQHKFGFRNCWGTPIADTIKIPTEEKLSPKYKRVVCTVCGGEGEHDWEVHNAELRSQANYDF